MCLRGRTVYVCFDSDARTNRNVARAMRRLGTWLRSRGVAKVLFVLPPGNAVLGKTGVDDYLSRGGTIQELLAVAEATAPDPDADDDSLTDSRLAERVTDEALADSFRWAPGLGWLEFTGRRWEDASEPRVVEIVRRYLRDLQHEAVSAGDRRLVSEQGPVCGAHPGDHAAGARCRRRPGARAGLRRRALPAERGEWGCGPEQR